MKYADNSSELLYKVNISVLSLQHARVGVSPYIIMSGRQKNNKRKKIGTDVLHECEADCNSLKETIFLNISVGGVAFESKWVHETIHRFLCGMIQHVGITDKNHNVKNNQCQNVGGYCEAVMGG